MDRDELVRGVQRALEARPEGLVAAYLFGSRARGTASAGSDLDLGLLFSEPPAPRHGGPADRIADALCSDLGISVEAVVLNGAPVDLVHRILRDGVLVFEADRSARIRFEVASRRDYLDLLPVLREYRAARSPS